MASASAQEIAPGLARWLAPHPDWRPECDWDRLVGCLLYELEEVAVLIDPLLPADGREAFLAWLDERIAGRQVSILTTIRWHARDRVALADRYRAQTRPRAWNALPAGVRQRPLRGAGETLYWLERAQALVPGDSLIGDDGGLALCPEGWLEDVVVDRRGLARLLRAQLELPVERVLVSHGQPVLHDGRAALARAITDAE
jgi:hypothetical protein